MKRTITIEVRENYGSLHYYPDCRQSKIFAHLLKQKTLTARDLAVITELDYEVEWTGTAVKRAESEVNARLRVGGTMGTM